MVRGICWVAGDSIIDCNLDPLINNHVNWISQTPFGWQQHHDSPEVHFGPSQGSWGETDAGLIQTAAYAHDKGMQVIMKPHIWIMQGNGKWRSDIEMNSKKDWETWFNTYSDFIMHYAKVAEAGNMEALCIGTELLIPSTTHSERWLELIQKIRAIYSGKLTYAANFYKEYESITFWNELDAIGIQGYFPLVKNNHPTKEQLMNAWLPHITKMESVARKYGKPIIFTEIGYKNSADAAIEPWTWPRQMGDQINESEETQAICLDAMFECLWNKDWFHGVFIWKWFHTTYRHPPEDYASYQEERMQRRKARGRINTGSNVTFSPQGMMGEEVMRKWFGLN